MRIAGEKDVDDLRTLMEEVAVRSAETKKAMYEFKRDVIVGGEDTLTGVVIADRVMRFFEDKIYSKQVLLDKATLKNNTYKGAMAKLEAQLVHKEEMGEVLHAVDFDQLKIENQQHMTTIDTKNKELLALKVANGRTVQALNTIKAHLSSLERHNASLSSERVQLRQEHDRLTSAFASTQLEAAKVERKFMSLNANQSRGQPKPTARDYMGLKHEVMEMQRRAGMR